MATEVRRQPRITFVFLHAAGLDRRMWAQIEREVERQGHRAMSLDLPGHGRRARPPHPLNLAHLADDVIEASHGFGVGMVLVGLSLGGMVAQLCASRVDQPFAGLVLADTLAASRARRLSSEAYPAARKRRACGCTPSPRRTRSEARLVEPCPRPGSAFGSAPPAGTSPRLSPPSLSSAKTSSAGSLQLDSVLTLGRVFGSIPVEGMRGVDTTPSLRACCGTSVPSDGTARDRREEDR